MNVLEHVWSTKIKFRGIEAGKAEKIVEMLLFLSALSSILVVFFIVAFMLKESVPALALGFDFIFGMTWHPAHNLIKPCVEMLVGIPSIVLGFFGLMVLVVLIRDSVGGYGECILAGWILLAIMTLPHVISISEDSIRAVPRAYKEASLALGATPLQTMRRVLLPHARSGIVASVTLGMGNAVGETMAVLMVIGNPNVPWILSSVLEPVRVLTSTIVLEIGYVAWGSMHQHALFALGIVLFVVVALLNAITTTVIRRRVSRRR